MITSQELHWAAGFLDGEGWFGKPYPGKPGGGTARINAAQKDDWPLQKLKAMFGGAVYHRYRHGRLGVRGGWMYRWDLVGNRAAQVMMTLYCLLSPRRQDRVRILLAEWKTRTYGSHNKAKTHCKRGHEFSPENTYLTRLGRNCRICGRMLRARWVQKQKPLKQEATQ